MPVVPRDLCVTHFHIHFHFGRDVKVPHLITLSNVTYSTTYWTASGPTN